MPEQHLRNLNMLNDHSCENDTLRKINRNVVLKMSRMLPAIIRISQDLSSVSLRLQFYPSKFFFFGGGFVRVGDGTNK